MSTQTQLASENGLATLRNMLGDYAKDIKINLGTVLKESPEKHLNINQIMGVALSSAYATRHQEVITHILAEAETVLTDAEIQAAKASATIMGMNNIYYRFVHLASDKSYQTMPAGLRMNVIGNPGIDKLDFELYALAVSAINGCGMCIDAHINVTEKGGISKEGIQQSMRIAAVINAAAQALDIG